MESQALLEPNPEVSDAQRKLLGTVLPTALPVKDSFSSAPCPFGLAKNACIKHTESEKFSRQYHYQEWIQKLCCVRCAAQDFEVINGVQLEKPYEGLCALLCGTCEAVVDVYEPL